MTARDALEAMRQSPVRVTFRTADAASPAYVIQREISGEPEWLEVSAHDDPQDAAQVADEYERQLAPGTLVQLREYPSAGSLHVVRLHDGSCWLAWAGDGLPELVGLDDGPLEAMRRLARDDEAIGVSSAQLRRAWVDARLLVVQPTDDPLGRAIRISETLGELLEQHRRAAETRHAASRRGP